MNDGRHDIQKNRVPFSFYVPHTRTGNDLEILGIILIDIIYDVWIVP